MGRVYILKNYLKVFKMSDFSIFSKIRKILKKPPLCKNGYNFAPSYDVNPIQARWGGKFPHNFWSQITPNLTLKARPKNIIV